MRSQVMIEARALAGTCIGGGELRAPVRLITTRSGRYNSPVCGSSMCRPCNATDSAISPSRPSWNRATFGMTL
jgi:hypothetical protein